MFRVNELPNIHIHKCTGTLGDTGTETYSSHIATEDILTQATHSHPAWHSHKHANMQTFALPHTSTFRFHPSVQIPRLLITQAGSSTSLLPTLRSASPRGQPLPAGGGRDLLGANTSAQKGWGWAGPPGT